MENIRTVRIINMLGTHIISSSQITNRYVDGCRVGTSNQGSFMQKNIILSLFIQLDMTTGAGPRLYILELIKSVFVA
jgi:hypothetical protein